MTELQLYDALRQALWVAILISAPLLAVALVAGIVIGLFQALTSIQEMTLTFVPKILSMFIALLLAFPWMMDKMLNFTRELFMNIPTYLR